MGRRKPFTMVTSLVLFFLGVISRVLFSFNTLDSLSYGYKSGDMPDFW